RVPKRPQQTLPLDGRDTARDFHRGTFDTMLSSGSHLQSGSCPRVPRGIPSRGRRAANLAAVLMAAAVGWGAATASAQSTSTGRYFPLDQTTRPGVAGQLAGVQCGFVPAIQPVRVELGGEGGQVAFYSGPDNQATTLEAPAVAGLCVGHVYRLKISDLPEFPGVELYPTVELVDRLHPPRGREVEFAIPIIVTAEEIAAALEGRLVTKVIYLEQPDRVIPVRSTTASRVRRAGPRDNAVALADEAGRPLVILRLGGRLPDAAVPEPGFFGTGAPVQFFGKQSPPVEAVRQ
ncbi:MAG: hypothetical protein ACM3U2_12190, partial [Deltaproteobacteria bacterium]